MVISSSAPSYLKAFESTALGKSPNISLEFCVFYHHEKIAIIFLLRSFLSRGDCVFLADIHNNRAEFINTLRSPNIYTVYWLVVLRAVRIFLYHSKHQ